MSNKKTDDIIYEIRKQLSNLLHILYCNIKLLGSGTYAHVFSIDNKRVVKIYQDGKSFRQNALTTCEFFEVGAFREIFFNQILNHHNLFKYTEIHYHPEIGIYAIGARMSGTMNDTQIYENFDENMFYLILSNMQEALKYLHGHGIIHSDIKPANILYKKIQNTINFVLCDFNLSQFCSIPRADRIVRLYTDPDKPDNDEQFNVFATSCYSTKEKRSVVTDIFMLGATIFCTMMRKHNQLMVVNEQINIAILQRFYRSIIQITNKRCYRILELMLLPLQNRIYLNHLNEIIKYRNKIREENDPTKIIDLNDLKDPLDPVNYLCPDEIRIYENIQTMKNFGHRYFNDNCKYEPINYAMPSGIIEIVNPFNGNASDRDIDILCSAYTNIIANKYSIDKKIARFLAQAISHYPRERGLERWAAKTHTPIAAINKAALVVSLKAVCINCHFLVCNVCQVQYVKNNINTKNFVPFIYKIFD
jgi:serine/threonine protein kinase